MYTKEFTPHSRPYTALIRSITKNNLPIQLVLDYWSKMQQNHVPLDAAAYTSIIAAHSDVGLFSSAREFFQEFQKSGQKPTIEMYSTMIVLYGKIGDIPAMEKLYHNVTRNYSHRLTKQYSMVLLNSLMSGYSFGGQWEKALILWNRLRSEIRPSDSKLAIKSLPDVFMRTSQEMTVKSFGVDPITVCIIIDALGFAERLEELRSVWKDIQTSGIPLVLNNITSFVEALIRCKQDEEALGIVLDLETWGFYPDSKILRNTVTLMDKEKRNFVLEKIQSKYPDVHFEIPETLLQFVPMKNGDQEKKGLTPLQLHMQMNFRRGVLLLPPLSI
jgi:pentatricopeptide repeat protein